MATYYNEIEPFAVQWLRELIKQGHIADGVVDERGIEDVSPADLRGFTQCHFFAGIGVWSYALRRAGWPDGRPVWTGSCPCQPFSSAGKGAGFADERHLWPAFHWLIEQCQPQCVFGEQVAGKAGETWLDLVSTDLENTGYACGSAVTAACGFGAPHQRKRLYWVAEPCGGERAGWSSDGRCLPNGQAPQREEGECDVAGGCQVRSVADANDSRPQGRERGRDGTDQWPVGSSGVGREGRGPTNGHWRDVDWLGCRDGKWRPAEPGTFPLADGAPARVGRLRGYGNAIVAQQAQAFIEAFIDC